MSNWTDKTIVEGLKKGERGAFKELYQRYSPSLMRQIFSLTYNREIAEEVLHETLITALDKINFFDLKEKGGLKAWLMRIATNKAIDLLRTQKRTVLENSVDEIPSIEGLTIQKESYISIQQEICKLPLLQRSAISLRVFDELSYLEISRILGVSISSIKQALFKGKKTLQQKISNNEWCNERI